MYKIGVQGQKWGDSEKAEWLSLQSIKRSYKSEVVEKVNALSSKWNIEQYGALSYDEGKYPLFAIKSNDWDMSKPTALVTGGVHGYETSGVQGAIQFADTEMANYTHVFNVVVLPCISPWGYETINRWNPKAIDPNRSFYADSPAEESAKAMAYIHSLLGEVFIHIDLHETTDTDNSEFRPALSARDAIEQKTWNIPDGFYLCADTSNPSPEFQKAMIDAVEKVTHIAPPDDAGEIIGVPLQQHGVITYDYKPLGLCAGLSDAKYTTTTEVYPDSPKVDSENCNLAQVACITGGLDFVIAKEQML
ncbi:M14 family metallocarboxypeptidase [Thalassotalea euphylliae]|uniref:M14 family metallopeptidase n=1 Tax=Thalassotalea euphylliae TaxID=1655234 RepID=UPI003640CAAF